MTTLLSRLGLSGELRTRKATRPGRVFRLGRLAVCFDPGAALIPGSVMFASHLEAAHFRGEDLLEVRDLGSGLVTTAGVNLLGGDWTNATATLKLSNQHDSGTGTVADAIGDTVLGTPTGNARVAGTQSNSTANIYKSVATLAYTASAAITEWGIFSAVTSGTLWDRRKFSAINVINGDSIQFTYQLTCTAGG